MIHTLHRRTFTQAMLAAIPALGAAKPRRLRIGYTCITWGAFPRGPEASATLENALRDISSLGFHGFETFPEILEDWDQKGALTGLIQKYGVPLTSAYIRTNLLDPAARRENLAQ